MSNRTFRLLAVVVALLALAMLFGCKGKKGSSSGGGDGIGDPWDPGGGGGGGGGGNPGSAEPIDLAWKVPGGSSSADKQWFADWIKRVLAARFWEGTEGQAYLRNQTITTGSPSGNRVEIRNSIRGANGSYGGASVYIAGGDAYYIVFLNYGDEHAQEFMHEMGHGYFGVRTEEYSCKNSTDKVCCMSSISSGTNSEGLSRRFYCDSGSCVGGARCWNNWILNKHSNWSHPGPLGLRGTGAHPTCNVTIQ